MVEKAFIQELGRGKLEPEMADLASGLKRRGVPVELFTEKVILRGRLAVTPRTLVAGWISVVERALQHLGVSLPEPDDYPAALESFLHRRVWRSTLAEVRGALELGQGPLFIKPAEKRKRFTGRVVESEADLWSLATVSARTPLWCSEVVHFASEQRFFVLRGRSVGARHYDGDPSLQARPEVVEQAVEAISGAGGAPVAYALDFGVLRDGRTAFVERNDTFGLGSYGLDPAVYTELTVARWEELVATPT